MRTSLSAFFKLPFSVADGVIDSKSMASLSRLDAQPSPPYAGRGPVPETQGSPCHSGSWDVQPLPIGLQSLHTSPKNSQGPAAIISKIHQHPVVTSGKLLIPGKIPAPRGGLSHNHLRKACDALPSGLRRWPSCAGPPHGLPVPPPRCREFLLPFPFPSRAGE